MRSSNILLCLVVWAFVPLHVRAQWDEGEGRVLPRNATPEESVLWQTYAPPANVPAHPPPYPVRALAEFEELEGIVLRWAYGTQNLLLSQIVDAAQEEGKVWILVRPGTSDSTNIKNYLVAGGIPLTNLEFLSISTNSIWSRDYGPWTVYSVVDDSLGIVDFIYNRPRPLDDVVPAALASLWGVPLYQTFHMPDSLVHTGGNFMVDGFGTGFSSELVITENPHLTHDQIDSTMQRFVGLERYITMPVLLYDVIHHIDMHMKLLDEETLLIGQYPVNRADYSVIESTVDYLRTITNCYGRPYRIIRIPMPPDASGRYPDNGSNYLTYTNSIIINKTVLVPVYNLPQDSMALEIYRSAMPGYRVIGYDCNSIIPQLGAIHCIAKEVGVREPVRIAHAQPGTVSDTTHDIRVAATIRCRSGVDSAFVVWRSDTTLPFSSVSMVDSAGVHVGYLPNQELGTTVWYYLQVHTGSGRTVTKPLVGSSGPYRILIRDTTVTSVAGLEHPLNVELSQNYPNPFNPMSIIEYGISSGAQVSLKVFNILGEEVGILFQGHQEQGRYSAVLDGNQLPTGVYFYRLVVSVQNSSTAITRRAVLLK